MHGRKRLAVALIGFLLFIAFVLGLLPPIPTPDAFDGDQVGTAIGTALLILAVIIAAISSAVSSARQMLRDPATRTRTAVFSTAVSAIIGVGFVALVVAALMSHKPR